MFAAHRHSTERATRCVIHFLPKGVLDLRGVVCDHGSINGYMRYHARQGGLVFVALLLCALIVALQDAYVFAAPVPQLERTLEYGSAGEDA